MDYRVFCYPQILQKSHLFRACPVSAPAARNRHPVCRSCAAVISFHYTRHTAELHVVRNRWKPVHSQPAVVHSLGIFWTEIVGNNHVPANSDLSGDIQRFGAVAVFLGQRAEILMGVEQEVETLLKVAPFDPGQFVFAMDD